MLFSLMSCTTMPISPKNVPQERKQQIVQNIIEHGQLIDLFKRAEEIYDKKLKSGALDISVSVEKYLQHQETNAEKITDILTSDGFSTKTFLYENIPLHRQCKRERTCNILIAGSKRVGTVYVVSNKSYVLEIDMYDNKVIKAFAYVVIG